MSPHSLTPFTASAMRGNGGWYKAHAYWVGVLRRGVGAQAEPVFRTPPEHTAFTLDHIMTRVSGSVSHADALIRETGGHCPTCGHSAENKLSCIVEDCFTAGWSRASTWCPAVEHLDLLLLARCSVHSGARAVSIYHRPRNPNIPQNPRILDDPGIRQFQMRFF